MKRILPLLFLIICLSTSYSKEPRWKPVFLPINDSIVPISLVFADSMNGYFYGAIEHHNPLIISRKVFGLPVFFSTTDGGRTWNDLHPEQIFSAEIAKDTLIYPLISFHNYLSLQYPFDLSSSNVITLHKFFSDTLGYYTSVDNGKNWSYKQSEPTISRQDCLPLGSLQTSQCLLLHFGNEKIKPQLFTSYNFGKKFVSNGDLDYEFLRRVFLPNEEGTQYPRPFFFDHFDEQHWIVVVPDSGNFHATTPGINYDTSRNYQLVTLLTSDGGSHWQSYVNSLPRFFFSDVFSIPAHCLRNSDYVYLNPGEREGDLWFQGAHDTVYNLASAEMYSGLSIDKSRTFYFPANYLYSSDRGKSWIEDTSFASRRRGFEAVAPGEVWCTISDKDTLKTDAMMAPYIIHTTDFGMHWEIDSNSLFDPEGGKYDGRVITFSDPRHGWIFARSSNNKRSAIYRLTQEDEAFTPYIPTYNETYKNYLRMYPDPASTSITFKTIVIYPVESIEISDMLGRRFECPYQLHPETKSVEVDIRSLSEGCYVGRLSCGPMMFALPFVVQH